MNPEIWKWVWNEFCDSQTHLDALLSRIPESFGPKAKAEVASRFGPFLRRPWAISQALGIHLAENPEQFWAQNFIQLRKNEAIHEVLRKLPSSEGSSGAPKLPSQGGAADFPPHQVQRWAQDWGEGVAQRLCELLSQDPLTVIRVHRNFEEKVAEAFPKSRRGRFAPRARVFKGYESVMNQGLYQEGALEVQDEGSQLMAWFSVFPELFGRALGESPQVQKKIFTEVLAEEHSKINSSLTVVDACAGAGGKTLALADILKGQGRIFAYDIYEKKIQALRRRATRARETNIQAVALDADALQSLRQKFSGSADLLLLDLPCGGEGVLRRNPDSKWTRKPLPKPLAADLPPIEELQRKIILDYLPLVKKGGRVVYGVCTFKKSETVEQVEWLNSSSFRDESGISLDLRESGFTGPYETDGFFMASFQVK